MNRDPQPLKTATVNSDELQITVLVYQSVRARMWIAQSLEHSMVAHGPSADAAFKALCVVLQCRVNHDTRHQITPLSQLKEAARIYWEANEQAVEFHPEDFDDSRLPAHLIPRWVPEPLGAGAI